MIYYYIDNIGFAIMVYVISVVAHEYGHFAYLRRRLGRDPKIYKYKGAVCIGTPKDYAGLSAKEKRRVYEAGLLFGVVPILVALVLSLYYIVLLIPYIYGAREDIKNWVRTW